MIWFHLGIAKMIRFLRVCMSNITLILFVLILTTKLMDSMQKL